MQRTLHRTIPIFIPELACPNQCTYCNQHLISGQLQLPTKQEIREKIELYLSSFPSSALVELGFFGGNFTGLSLAEQEELLRIVEPYLKKGRIAGIRLSTRPDSISESSLSLLKEYQVSCIELGVQSTDDEVLFLVKRGYNTKRLAEVSEAILGMGFELGMQMMIGLPGSNHQKELKTAKQIIAWGAKQVRVYPTLVIEGTSLAKDYHEGNYKALSMEEAVETARQLLLLFEEHEVRVLRMGLHPTEDFIQGKGYLAGPFHVSFKELVLTEIWYNLLKDFSPEKGALVSMRVPQKELNYAIGYQSANKSRLERMGGIVTFIPSENLKNREFEVLRGEGTGFKKSRLSHV